MPAAPGLTPIGTPADKTAPGVSRYGLTDSVLGQLGASEDACPAPGAVIRAAGRHGATNWAAPWPRPYRVLVVTVVERGPRLLGRCGVHGPLLAIGAAIALAVLTALTLASAPANAAFPGLSGKIYCAGHRGTGTDLEIFSANPDGTSETVLSDNTFRDSGVAISPDGSKIAFESARDGKSEIYVANNDGDLAGPDVTRLTSSAGAGTTATDTSPSWSPDGSEIVFHSGRVPTDGYPAGTPTIPAGAGKFEIYVMSATTGEAGSLRRLTRNRLQDAIPSWSPDGTKIAFQRLNPTENTQLGLDLEVFTMNPDGTGQTNVSNRPGTLNDPTTMANENSDGLDKAPIWSPDSTQLAFRAPATTSHRTTRTKRSTR